GARLPQVTRPEGQTRLPPPPVNGITTTLSSVATAPPEDLFTVEPQIVPSPAMSAAPKCPYSSWASIIGSPVTAPLSLLTVTAATALAPSRAVTTVPSAAAQPPTPGRSGHD